MRSSVLRVLAGHSLRRRLGGWRFLGALALAALPGLQLILTWRFGDDVELFPIYRSYVVPLCLYFLTPFATMLTMLPVVGELYESGAVGYLYTRPTPRWASLLGLYLGAEAALVLVLAFGAFAPALFGLTVEPGGDWLRVAFGLWAALALGGLAYGALCLFLGVWSRRAILWALFVLVFWGAALGSLPGSLRSWSLHHYLFGLVRHWCDVEDAFSGMFPPIDSPPGVLRSVLVLLAAAAVGLGLTSALAERKDVAA